MKSKIILGPIFALVVVGSTLIGASTMVFAQKSNTPLSGLAQALATKYNLNQSDVQNFISTYMQQHRGQSQVNMQQMQKKRLDQLVSQGKISNAQEVAILNELETLQKQLSSSSFKTMTQAQRQTVMKNDKNTLTQWAKSQGISPAYVMPFGGHRGGWNKTAQSPTPTP